MIRTFNIKSGGALQTHPGRNEMGQIIGVGPDFEEGNKNFLKQVKVCLNTLTPEKKQEFIDQSYKNKENNDVTPLERVSYHIIEYLMENDVANTYDSYNTLFFNNAELVNKICEIVINLNDCELIRTLNKTLTSGKYVG